MENHKYKPKIGNCNGLVGKCNFLKFILRTFKESRNKIKIWKVNLWQIFRNSA